MERKSTHPKITIDAAAEPEILAAVPGDGHSTPETSLAIMERANIMLAEADTIQKAKELKDLFLTAADWARHKGMGEKAIQHAHGYAMRAKIKMGEMLIATKPQRAKAGRKKIDQPAGSILIGSSPTLADMKITLNESADAQVLAQMPADVQEQIIAGKSTVKKAKRKSQAAKREADKQAQIAKMPIRPTIHRADAFAWMETQSPCDLLLTDPPYSTDIDDIATFALMHRDEPCC